MHIAELFYALFFRPDVEVVIAALPELLILRAFELFEVVCLRT